MNPHAARSISPFTLINTLKTHRSLIYSLTKREVIGRYRGSIMGILWSFFNPVLMLIVYTFVFSVVFKARWDGGTDSRTEFALVLFAGLMIYNLFAECITRSPGLVLGNVNYVKKVVFPLEILSIVTMGSAVFHFLISFLVWLIFYLVFFGVPQVTLLLFPLLLIPFLLLILGLSWFLAALGVFLRDVSQIVGVMMTALLFLSPIFYPITALPTEYHQFLQINPLTFVIEQARGVMIWGNGISWQGWIIYLLLATVTAWLGFAWFQKTRKGFANVL
ncbi:lipopolysaccharide transport system permease protein [Nitrosomonas ureae]|uniref:Transport permease protein n=1 Tax=Nitrosomonas ureae TaxID=44577 RepID=A0A285C286_9PROT|nr:ABC transporter permease [Nitrosomonas ureae]SNX61188.1 lipopolysaccharide transport system permease protein [Nitrosomonas ureae]